MPSRAPRPCTQPGCPKMAVKKGRCEDHQRKAWGERGSAASRGYGHKWRKLRETIMMRDQWLCQVCKATGRVTTATAVDHILPKAQGGTDTPANLQAICDQCHKEKTQRESNGD